MNQSETIGSLAGALAKAQGAIRFALRDSANPFFKSKYADLASVVEAIRDPLSQNGLAWIQRIHESQREEVRVETIILHDSGEWISCGILTVPVSKADAQGHGSALTYARRYSVSAAFGVAADDDDGNAAAKAAPPARPRDTPTPPVSEEWSEEERQQAKQMAYDFGDALVKNGVTEDEAEAQVKRYLGQVGDGTFIAYSNRIASATVRTVPKSVMSPEVILEIMNATDLPNLEQLYLTHYNEAKQASNKQMLKAIVSAKDQRKAELARKSQETSNGSED